MSGIVITGGSGYIGQEVIRAALNTRDPYFKGGHTVVNIDIRPPRGPHTRLQQLAYFDVNVHPRVKFIQADLSEPREASRALDSATQLSGDVVGVANLSGLVKYGHAYEQLYGPNVKTVENLTAECAARKWLFIHLSGTAVHGNGLRCALKESDSILPVEAYGRSKAESERVVFSAVQERGLKAIVFRSTAPIGPDPQVYINKLYEMIASAPVIPAIKDSNNTYVSTEDIGRVFVYSLENSSAVFAKEPKAASDIVYNLGANKPLSDREMMIHLQESIFGRVKKPIIQLPSGMVLAIGGLSTAAAHCVNFVFRRNIEPDLPYELAKLSKGWHCQDPSRFVTAFGAKGFLLKHDEPEKVLDFGAAYKFLTDWIDRPAPGRLVPIMRRFLAERTSAAYN